MTTQDEATPDRAVRVQSRTAEKRVNRPSDVPMDTIGGLYTPPRTSAKASFRSDGSDHQRDQEQTESLDQRWNDEDRFTNKSGDPRIGTRGRSYEPGETRDEQR